MLDLGQTWSQCHQGLEVLWEVSLNPELPASFDIGLECAWTYAPGFGEDLQPVYHLFTNGPILWQTYMLLELSGAEAVCNINLVNGSSNLGTDPEGNQSPGSHTAMTLVHGVILRPQESRSVASSSQ